LLAADDVGNTTFHVAVKLVNLDLL